MNLHEGNMNGNLKRIQSRGSCKRCEAERDEARRNSKAPACGNPQAPHPPLVAQMMEGPGGKRECGQSLAQDFYG